MKWAMRLSVFFWLVSFGCATPEADPAAVSPDSGTTRELALQFGQAGTVKALTQMIRDGHGQAPIQHVLANAGTLGLSAGFVQRFQDNAQRFENVVLATPLADDQKADNGQDPLWLLIPAQEDTAVTTLEAFDSDGNSHVLSASEAPERPVITIGPDESLTAAELAALSAAADVRAQGLARSWRAADHVFAEKLDTLSFQDVKEPWFKGGPEIYTVISYIDKNGKGSAAVVAIDGIRKDKRTHNVNKVLHLWPENRYQIMDVGFMEKDSGYSYDSLVKILIEAAATAVTTFVPESMGIPNMVAAVLAKVIDAIPRGFWTDDDDYLDTINTIVKYENQNRSGVSGNATATFSSFEVKYNDE